MKTYYISAYVRFPFSDAHTVIGDLIAGENQNSAIRQFYDDYEIPEVPTPECHAQILAVTEVKIVE
jgi:hypothetical protein